MYDKLCRMEKARMSFNSASELEGQFYSTGSVRQHLYQEDCIAPLQQLCDLWSAWLYRHSDHLRKLFWTNLRGLGIRVDHLKREHWLSLWVLGSDCGWKPKPVPGSTGAEAFYIDLQAPL